MEPISKEANFQIKSHILQSVEWGQVKTDIGTPAVRVGSTQFTKHKIPFTHYYYGYAPKINPMLIEWDKLKEVAEKENCIAINFDCPNILKNYPESEEAENILNKYCKVSPKNTFAKCNVLLDISKTEEQLLADMHHKTRYNIKLAEKKGVKIRRGQTQEDFQIFYKLHAETAERQGFHTHSQNYFDIIWKNFSTKNMAYILIAEVEKMPVSAWMLFVCDNIIYYPYGGWNGRHQNLFPNNLLCWETIKLGKELNCSTFDMWGASCDLEKTQAQDPWIGFTKFKIGFGGTHVTHIDSYDFVLNNALYESFNLANKIRWALLKAKKR